MTYAQSLEYIHGLHRFGRKPELTRMALLMQRLGDPQRSLRFVHVAGTNGKGSTSVMLATILQQAGYRVGCYTSPYIVDFRERLMLDGAMIGKTELAALVAEVKEAAEWVEQQYESPREFEFITACALLWYHRKQADVVVLEVGIGGRFDATNVIDAPLAAVICPIGLDHMELLGDSVEAIAGEKCGIIKPGSVVIANAAQPPEAMDVIVEHCRRTHCPLSVPQTTQLSVQASGLDGSRFTYHGHPFRVSLVGPHQVSNAVTAIDAALALSARGLPLTLQQIAAGIEKAYIPGRLEVFPGTPTILLDGAHNPHGMAALRESLFAAPLGSVTAVIGMLADKNSGESLDIIAPYLKQIVATEPLSPRALPAADLAELARPYCDGIVTEPDCHAALALAARSGSDTVLVCGSLYLVSELRGELAKKLL